MATLTIVGHSRSYRRRKAMGWVRFAVLLVVAVVIAVPMFAVVLLAFHPSSSGTSPIQGWTFEVFQRLFTSTNIPQALVNSLIVGVVSTIVGVAVGALGGYVVSRARSRLIQGYSLLLFVIQALPQIVFVIPLFLLFAQVQLVDSLIGVVIVYVATAISVVTWMMASYFDSIPVELEEAAWVDGLTRMRGLFTIVLPNAGPGILSAGVFTFLVAWNDFLVATVFLKSNAVHTMPVAIQQFFQQGNADWPAVMASAVLMVIPPLVVFLLMGRRFGLGGIAGSLAGR